MKTKLCLLIAAGVLAAAVPLAAHHAFSAEFDADRPVKLTGRVVKMEWINPHAWIYMDVKGEDGKTQTWMVETGAPNALIRRGWTKNSVPEGMEITVEGYQSKDGALRANGRNVLLPDGRQLFAGSSGTGAPGEVPEK